MKMADGKIATNGKENIAVFSPHFEGVFNNRRPVDLTILTDVPQRPTLHDLDLPITYKEVDAVINKFKNEKSPGLNGIPQEAYKAMNTKTRCKIHKFFMPFLNAKLTMRVGTTANVSQFPSLVICPIQTNGTE